MSNTFSSITRKIEEKSHKLYNFSGLFDPRKSNKMRMVGVIIWKNGNMLIIWKMKFRITLNDLFQICKRSPKQDSWLVFNILLTGDCHTIYLFYTIISRKNSKGVLKKKNKKLVRRFLYHLLEIAYLSLKHREENKSGVIKIF